MGTAVLTYAQIETLIGRRLPPSALADNGYAWTNAECARSRSRLQAGYRTWHHDPMEGLCCLKGSNSPEGGGEFFSPPPDVGSALRNTRSRRGPLQAECSARSTLRDMMPV
jgi:hypothetical protein